MFHAIQHKPVHEIVKEFGCLVPVIWPHKRSDDCRQFAFAFFVQAEKTFFFLIFDYMPKLQFYGDKFRIQGEDLPPAHLNEFFSPCLACVIGKCAVLQCRNKADLFTENVFRDGFCFPCFKVFLIDTEKFKVCTVVKNQKTAFVYILSVNLIGAGKPFAQPCSPSYHLPEFCFWADFFEKHQIYNFRHVYARVQHINGNGYMRFFFGLFEIVNKALYIGIVTNHTAGKGSAVLRIQFVETLHNKISMAFVLGKNNGFSQTVTACSPNAFFH